MVKITMVTHIYNGCHGLKCPYAATWRRIPSWSFCSQTAFCREHSQALSFGMASFHMAHGTADKLLMVLNIFHKLRGHFCTGKFE